MRLVPAGAFEMGSDTISSKELPVHTVSLDPFYMDEHEVTNAMYARCVAADGCSEPSHGSYANAEVADHPVTYVSWEQAGQYCAWAGARLPTEAEWEKAGRGGLGGMTYPWGNDNPVCTPGAINGAQSDVCDGDTVPVKSFGPNGYGLYDMAGNVWEWVADWYDDGYYASLTSGVSNPSGPATGTYRVLRGGSWSDDEFGVRVALRNWLDPGDTSYYVTGFRCSRSLFEDERPVTTQPAPLSGSIWTRPADEMTMQQVPAGEFQMGRDLRRE